MSMRLVDTLAAHGPNKAIDIDRAAQVLSELKLLHSHSPVSASLLHAENLEVLAVKTHPCPAVPGI
jgi:isochorismate synthase EntC